MVILVALGLAVNRYMPLSTLWRTPIANADQPNRPLQPLDAPREATDSKRMAIRSRDGAAQSVRTIRSLSGACRIKGNISRSGERIYHVPGGRWYERTRINPSKGERWFCSEEEARAAGWRKSFE